MVRADIDQSLAAEPGFHGDAPQGGGKTWLILVRGFLDHRSDLLEKQSKYFWRLKGKYVGPRAQETAAAGVLAHYKNLLEVEDAFCHYARFKGKSG